MVWVESRQDIDTNILLSFCNGTSDRSCGSLVVFDLEQ
jgi:hypothetical protein